MQKLSCMHLREFKFANFRQRGKSMCFLYKCMQCNQAARVPVRTCYFSAQFVLKTKINRFDLVCFSISTSNISKFACDVIYT